VAKQYTYHSSMQFVREHCQTFGASNTVNTRAYVATNIQAHN